MTVHLQLDNSININFNHHGVTIVTLITNVKMFREGSNVRARTLLVFKPELHCSQILLVRKPSEKPYNSIPTH